MIDLKQIGEGPDQGPGWRVLTTTRWPPSAPPQAVDAWFPELAVPPSLSTGTPLPAGLERWRARLRDPIAAQAVRRIAEAALHSNVTLLVEASDAWAQELAREIGQEGLRLVADSLLRMTWHFQRILFRGLDGRTWHWPEDADDDGLASAAGLAILRRKLFETGGGEQESGVCFLTAGRLFAAPVLAGSEVRGALAVASLQIGPMRAEEREAVAAAATRCLPFALVL